jgi:hypothetical protein
MASIMTNATMALLILVGCVRLTGALRNVQRKCILPPNLAPMRVVEVPANHTMDDVKQVVWREFKQDDEPVVIKGMEQYLLTGVGKEALDFLSASCADQDNAVAAAANTLQGFLGGLQEYHVAKNPQKNSCGVHDPNLLFKLNGCPAINANASDPVLFSHGLPNGRNDPQMWGGHGGTFGNQHLHIHLQWRPEREEAFANGRFRKYVTHTLFGRKTWIVYPGRLSTVLQVNQSDAPAATQFSFDPFSKPSKSDSQREDGWAWQAKGWKVTLDPGDLLVLPSYNLHHVHNDERTLAYTYAVDIDMDQPSH